MARIRSIKPGFFLNEDVAALPFEWRLLFVGLWTQADRDGRLEDRPARLKAMLFPYDDLDVNDGLGRLDAAGLITRYEGNGLRLIAIPTWAKHQQPNVKESQSDLPPPVSEKHCACTVPALQEGKGAGVGKELSDRAAVRASFDRFWAVYPRKVGKDVALKLFERLRPDSALVDAMISAVKVQAIEWNDPKFIPHPKTWLSHGRWKDEQAIAKESEDDGVWRCPHVDRCGHRKMCEAATILGRPEKAAS
jgi:hypothetical protein